MLSSLVLCDIRTTLVVVIENQKYSVQ